MNTWQEKFVNCSHELDAAKKALEKAESDTTLRRSVQALIAATDVISHISGEMSEALAANKIEKAAAPPCLATDAALPKGISNFVHKNGRERVLPHGMCDASPMPYICLILFSPCLRSTLFSLLY